MTRDQWANWVGTFMPLQNKLLEYATDPSTVSNAMAEASENVNDAFAAQQGITQRRLAQQGVSLSADEQGAQDRAFSLTKSLADVHAQNTARDLTKQRQQSIMGNPAPQGV